jgi:hypothetical protein
LANATLGVIRTTWLAVDTIGQIEAVSVRASKATGCEA